jgi:lipoyl(octanoyl) transferase
VCRLILSATATPGRWNMAVDEALLEAAVVSGQPVVRWYSWSEPTISLGYFQSDEELAADPVLSRLAQVRRLTGGGAILHHHEWTYSCVLPPEQRLVRHPYDLYDLVHEEVIACFREEQGIELQQRGQSRRGPAEPALCFLREDSHDVCYRGLKILGSAQRRRKGALLQHGSLLLGRSEFAPQVAGVNDLVSEVKLTSTFGNLLAQRLASSIGESVLEDALTPDERRRAGELSS